LVLRASDEKGKTGNQKGKAGNEIPKASDEIPETGNEKGKTGILVSGLPFFVRKASDENPEDRNENGEDRNQITEVPNENHGLRTATLVVGTQGKTQQRGARRDMACHVRRETFRANVKRPNYPSARRTWQAMFLRASQFSAGKHPLKSDNHPMKVAGHPAKSDKHPTKPDGPQFSLDDYPVWPVARFGAAFAI